MADMTYDVVIVGASLGGVAAALRAGAFGASVCLLEATTWVGGQFTLQGVCKPDEHRWIENIGSAAAYRDFRHRCRLHYRNNYKLSAAGASQPLLNPGGPYNANQPQFAVEPRIADAILKRMLSDTPSVHLRLQSAIRTVDVADDSIIAVTAVGPDNSETRYLAQYFLDATDLGDVLPLVLSRNEYVIGAESESDTHEPGAPAIPRPNWIQPITFCIALEHRPDGNFTIQKPADYDALKAEQHYKLIDGAITTMFEGDDWQTTMWNYRRYIHARNFDDPAFPYDLSMINTGSNDYQKASLPSDDPAQDAAVIARARQATLGYLYWLQTECPRDSRPGTFGYPELKPNENAFGSADGVAPTPYIRESRRILSMARVLAQDIMKDGNPGPRASLFLDSCGIGTYQYMDSHKLSGAQPPMSGFWIDIYPVQIPMGSLIPRRVKNLLAACKNIGTTHFTNGLYRLHPFEWNIGEAAGALAAFSVRQKIFPRDVTADNHLLRSFQRQLIASGIPLFWWTDIQVGDPLYSAVQMAGVTQIMTGDGNAEMRFNPGDPLADTERAAIEAKAGRPLPQPPLSRGQAALWLFNEGLT